MVGRYENISTLICGKAIYIHTDGHYVDGAVGVGLRDGGSGCHGVLSRPPRPPDRFSQTTSPVGRCWWQRPPNSLTSSSAPHNHQSQSSQCPALVPCSIPPNPQNSAETPSHQLQVRSSRLPTRTLSGARDVENSDAVMRVKAAHILSLTMNRQFLITNGLRWCWRM